MKILFLGGTRFLGLSLLEKLSSKGFNVTVLSRRKVEGMSGVHFLKGEKNNLLQELTGIKFDVVIDFISYGLEDVKLNLNTLSFGKYYFISSLWLTKIAPGQAADDFITSMDEKKFKNLPEVTRRYLLGKLNVEKFIYDKNRPEKKFNIIRLPVFLGKKDHTRRIHYYIERVVDEHDILLLNDGLYEAQIAWEKDLSELLCNFIEKGGGDYLIWEALPMETVRIIDIFRYLEDSLDTKNEYISKEVDVYKRYFPEYLEHEPLWREEINEITSHNLFSDSKTKSTEYRVWLTDISKEIVSVEEIKETPIRKKEAEFIKNL